LEDTLKVIDQQSCTKSSPVETAEKVLHASSYPGIRELRCSFGNGVLTLAGRLPSYYQKQVALQAVRQIGGVDGIDIRIEVAS